MAGILIGSLLISIMHAIIPSHWLPVITIGRNEQWTLGEVRRVTLYTGLAHALCTVAIGLIAGMLGKEMAERISFFTYVIAPVMLILLGLFFIYRHHHHHHFAVKAEANGKISKQRLIGMLVLAMFLSPCMEIEGYYLLAGAQGINFVLLVSALYTLVTVTGMVIWVSIAYRGLLKLNWHRVEHNSGLITGGVLIITGMLTFLIA